ncbi:MAG: hypothetical protein IJZ53_12475 [Tyzzerella sp.]|nr:hypothetical protein [Tyzzerella sp.]
MHEEQKKKLKIRMPILSLKRRLFLYLATIIFAAFALYFVAAGEDSLLIQIPCYVCAAVTLAFSCYYLVFDIRYIASKEKRTIEVKNPFLNRMLTDLRFKIFTTSVFSMILNVAFAIFNGAIGIISKSAWFGTLSAYYLLLAGVRLTIIYHETHAKKKTPQKQLLGEIEVYRRCGISLVWMTVPLGATVYLLTSFEGEKYYPGLTIYIVAAYTFYKVIMAVINMLKAERGKEPLIMAARQIGYADAWVSLLSMQAAMILSFGEGQREFSKMMNGITGEVVSVIILITGLRMIHLAGKMKREAMLNG